MFCAYVDRCDATGSARAIEEDRRGSLGTCRSPPRSTHSSAKPHRRMYSHILRFIDHIAGYPPTCVIHSICWTYSLCMVAIVLELHDVLVPKAPLGSVRTSLPALSMCNGPLRMLSHCGQGQAHTPLPDKSDCHS
jgi:hypothetical protein